MHVLSWNCCVVLADVRENTNIEPLRLRLLIVFGHWAKSWRTQLSNNNQVTLPIILYCIIILKFSVTKGLCRNCRRTLKSAILSFCGL